METRFYPVYGTIPFFQTDMDSMLKQKPFHAVFHISSTGGRGKSVLRLIDNLPILRNHGFTFTTVADGVAASMASILLAAGDPGQRYVLPDSAIGIHGPALPENELPMLMNIPPRWNIPNEAQFRLQTMKKMLRWKMRDAYTALSGQGRELWDPMLVDETMTWLTPSDAIRAGLADHIGYPQGLREHLAGQVSLCQKLFIRHVHMGQNGDELWKPLESSYTWGHADCRFKSSSQR